MFYGRSVRVPPDTVTEKFVLGTSRRTMEVLLMHGKYIRKNSYTPDIGDEDVQYFGHTEDD